MRRLTLTLLPATLTMVVFVALAATLPGPGGMPAQGAGPVRGSSGPAAPATGSDPAALHPVAAPDHVPEAAVALDSPELASLPRGRQVPWTMLLLPSLGEGREQVVSGTMPPPAAVPDAESVTVVVYYDESERVASHVSGMVTAGDGETRGFDIDLTF